MAVALAPQRLLDEAEDLHPRLHPGVFAALYASHFLSAWNSRMFEFGSFLFLASLFPDTLLPASIYALSRSAAAAVLSPPLGSYVDRADRLTAVRVSIVAQRLSVACSCVGLFLVAEWAFLRSPPWFPVCLLLLSVLACVEKLASVLNAISVERDWVVIVAQGHAERLRALNSQMRRIDLFCKLFGPLAVALLDGYSTRIAIIATGALTLLSVVIEYSAIARVYRMIPALREPKHLHLARMPRHDAILARTKSYIEAPAFLPSFSLALLHLTVLSFSGQMVTYLVALRLSSTMIGSLRAVSAISELSATYFAPKIMSRIGAVRAGIWFLNWEIACLIAACSVLWWELSPAATATGLVSTVVASRLGLWGYDLSAQLIVQEEVEEADRGNFSSQEFALQNIFEMLAFASTIVFSRPAQFKYSATISAIAVALAGVFYAVFVRSRRGHLIHICRCLDRHEMRKKHHHWWQTIPEADPLVENSGHERANHACD
ncbi:Solute carrier family 40 member [Cercospora zeina]